MVMFAFTLLLISLMVMMTLSFGTKMKEKIELQQVADQGAYSNAVVVARGFNSLALLNRVQIAHMVAIAGIQAAVSYAASYRGLLDGAEKALMLSMNDHGNKCNSSIGLIQPECQAAKELRNPVQQVRDEQDRVEYEWTRPTVLGALMGNFGMQDTVTGLYAMLWQMNALSIFLIHQQEVFQRMAAKLDEQTLVREIMRHAVGGRPEWNVPRPASFVSNREIGDITVGSGAVNGATLRASVWNQHAVVAAMASRGNWWVTARLGESGVLEKRLNKVFNPPPGATKQLPFYIKRTPVDFTSPMNLAVDAALKKMEGETYLGTDLVPVPALFPTITVQLVTPSLLIPLPPLPSWFPPWLVSFLPIPYLGKGDSYFGASIHDARWFIPAPGPLGKPNDVAAVADDHASGILYFHKAPIWNLRPIPRAAIPGLAEPLLFSGFGFASAGATPNLTNKHMWIGFPFPAQMAEVGAEAFFRMGGALPGLGGSDRPPKHLMAPLSGFGIWPPFIDYNFEKVALADDAYGQPKNFAVVQRNYADPTRQPDPWNLFFRFRFNGPGTQYGQGNNANHNAIVLQDGTDISMQTALSSGIAYYHRYGHWKETPNLFNPFWRAGLTRANVDRSDGLGRQWFEDAAETMNRSNVPWAGEAIKELNRVGFEGVQ
ncbi:MAG: hypothetical protein K1X64_22315 [Myxococcaceae bacterium]|nr:hypothetical protein [Myxococcaceae bacterium]